MNLIIAKLAMQTAENAYYAYGRTSVAGLWSYDVAQTYKTAWYGAQDAYFAARTAARKAGAK